jgi:hypothetical protein
MLPGILPVGARQDEIRQIRHRAEINKDNIWKNKRL